MKYMIINTILPTLLKETPGIWGPIAKIVKELGTWLTEETQEQPFL